MTEFILKGNIASFMSITDNTLQIQSPVEWKHKSTIGIHLQGLRKPEGSCRIQFTPSAQISATKLEWIMDGAILHIQKQNDKIINVGQLLGTLIKQPYCQNGVLMKNYNEIVFPMFH